MQFEIIPVTLFQSNCVVVWDPETRDGAVFDPGGEPHRILAFIEDQKIEVKGIFLTHGHVDHVSGTNKLREATGAPVYLHPADKPLAEHTSRQCIMFGIPAEEAPEVDRDLAEGDKLELGALKFEVLHTPGHSPGCVCFLFGGDQPLMVGGDLLFAGSIGRTDLPGGDMEKMKASLARIRELNEDLVVIPGHGPQTTIGREKSMNPYLRGGLSIW